MKSDIFHTDMHRPVSSAVKSSSHTRRVGTASSRSLQTSLHSRVGCSPAGADVHLICGCSKTLLLGVPKRQIVSKPFIPYWQPRSVYSSIKGMIQEQNKSRTTSVVTDAEDV